jgi:type IV pilus assembly protein PilQ
MATEKNSADKNKITAVESTQGKDALDITLKGTTAPTYTVYELFKPARIVVDVADTTIAKGIALELPKESNIKLTTSAITDTKPPLTRFTFTLPESRQFSVVQKVNDIVLNISSGHNVPPAKTKNVAKKEKAVTAIAVSDINVVTTPKETVVKLLTTGKVPSYHYDVLEKKGDTPPRLYVDINNVTGDTLVKEHHIGTALADIRVAKRGTGLRFVFDSSSNTIFPFQVASLADGIEIRIQEERTKKTGKQDEVSNLIKQKQMIESQLPAIDASQQNAEAINAQTVATSMEDAFNFSGYTKERITVDFYKIDLHNVFRLIREISKTNIIVDESVSGSLTLALNDVPWDFALDIILNLKDLQKEERFNTIVIHPKSKKFSWPQRAEDNLSFETDEKVTEQEAILIQQQMNIPKTVIAAKQSIAKAQAFEKKEEFEMAISQYQAAFDKWPENAKLAGKIASIYLVQLRQNAKALYFAKKALKVDRKSASAALTAAIASANMQEMKKAQHYFDQAVQGKKPLREALLSYAAFSEQQKHYPGTLKLIKRHDELYGENLDSMITRARIFDKLGKHADATAEYKKIFYSGYRIAPDLKKFIQGRIALSQTL